MNNTEKSEVVVARILNVVAENGLQSMQLTFESLDLDPEYEKFFDLSAQWLINEGIIRVEDIDRILGQYSGQVSEPVITAYGFSLLDQRFPFDSETGTLGEAVAKVSESGKPYSQIGDFFGGLLGGFTKSLGNG